MVFSFIADNSFANNNLYIVGSCGGRMLKNEPPTHA
jgi:hypothetical protein